MPVFKVGDIVKVRETPTGLPFFSTRITKFISEGRGTVMKLIQDKHKLGFILVVKLPSKTSVLIHQSHCEHIHEEKPEEKAAPE